MIKKTLLINPPTGRYMRSDRCQAPVDTRTAEPARPPMELAYMAAVLEALGIECKIKDYPMEGEGWQKVSADLKSFMPDMLIINTTTPTIDEDLKICGIAKSIKPDVQVIARGAHFLVFDKEILEKHNNLDAVIRGEPEITIQELGSGIDYSKISGITFRRGREIIRNADRPFCENLDELPFPARHLLNNRLYRTPDTNEPIAFINTSRGCADRCIFCAAGIVSGYKIRPRSVKSVIDEIEECIRKYKIRNFFFAADTFTRHKQWLIDFCNEVLRKGLKIRWGANSRVDTLDEEKISLMKKAGCYVIGFGAESGSQPMLDKMGKGITVRQTEDAVILCNKYDIKSYLIFVIGLPWETKETIADTIKFIRGTQASFIEVNVAYPIPGTEFYKIAKDEGLFNENNLLNHNYSSPLVRTFTLSTCELSKFRKEILKAFYMRPGYILKRIMKINSPGVALNHFKYGIRLIKNLMV